ncbi:hypothetical protein [Sandaracinus amylolyticus]|uniref:hypothetical protein n=1 Tax=Sandaracinus amylolyticus TaxID=927083 RepID=UPI001F1B0DF3|nr:hypothetical protein [Sandaracinus amylolyticus]
MACTPEVPDVPPREAPWTPPPGLDAERAAVISEAIVGTSLDPWALELREVEVWDNDVWHVEGSPRRTAGWVRRDPSGGAPFVLVHGLWWLAYAVGPRVDLAAACEALLEMQAIPVADRDWDLERALNERCAPALAVVALSETHPELAVRVARQWLEGGAAYSASAALHFERAITAHMRGDHCLALADARVVAAEWREIQRTLTGEQLGYWEYLEEIEPLLADLERRARQSRPVMPEVPAEGPVPAELVPALIAALEDVAQRQYGQPGGVSLSRHPIVDALIRVGEPAIPALLDTLEHDDRLTRSVHFWRDFVPARTVLAVHEAAYTALANILESSGFEVVATGDDLTSRGPSGRARVAAAMRRLWELTRGLPPERRRARILADDGAGSLAWAEAAEWIVSRERSARLESSLALPWIPRSVSPDAPMRGEPLRADIDPTITEQMVRRASDALADDRERHACELVGAALQWDFDAATRALRPFGRACIRAEWCGCAPTIVAALDDRALLREYARWPGLADLDGAYELWPILAHPNAPETRQLAARLFAERGALARRPRAPDRLVTRTTLAIPELRAFLRRALDDDAEVGQVDRWEDGLGITFDGGWFAVDDPTPLEGPQPIRRRDIYALDLSTLTGVGFSMAWPIERRDAAIARMLEALADETRWRLEQ